MTRPNANAATRHHVVRELRAMNDAQRYLVSRWTYGGTRSVTEKFEVPDHSPRYVDRPRRADEYIENNPEEWAHLAAQLYTLNAQITGLYNYAAEQMRARQEQNT